MKAAEARRCLERRKSQSEALENQVLGKFFRFTTSGDPDVVGSVSEGKLHHNCNNMELFV